MKKLNVSLAVLALLLFFSISLSAQRKVDEYGFESSDSESGRLDNLLSQLMTSPQAKGYVIMHKPKKWGTGRFLRRFEGIKRYVKIRRVDLERINFVAGEEKDESWNELWIVSPSEKHPHYKTISLQEKLREKLTKKTLFDSLCLHCSPTVDLELGLLDGLDFYAEALKANPNSKASIIIGKYQFFSQTRKERQKLIGEILNMLIKKNQIQKNRISIRFINSDYAELYIIPGKSN